MTTTNKLTIHEILITTVGSGEEYFRKVSFWDKNYNKIYWSYSFVPKFNFD